MYERKMSDRASNAAFFVIVLAMAPFITGLLWSGVYDELGLETLAKSADVLDRTIVVLYSIMGLFALYACVTLMIFLFRSFPHLREDVCLIWKDGEGNDLPDKYAERYDLRRKRMAEMPPKPPVKGVSLRSIIHLWTPCAPVFLGSIILFIILSNIPLEGIQQDSLEHYAIGVAVVICIVAYYMLMLYLSGKTIQCLSDKEKEGLIALIDKRGDEQ